MTKRQLERTEARFTRGQAVSVHEENRRPWAGVVRSVKWSPASGWWVEIAEDDTIATLAIPERFVAGEPS